MSSETKKVPNNKFCIECSCTSNMNETNGLCAHCGEILDEKSYTGLMPLPEGAEPFKMRMREEGPKDMDGKPEWSVLPWDALEQVVRAFEYGAADFKYKEPYTYYQGIKFSKLFSAAIRHLTAWFFKREEFIPDPHGMPGCTHAHILALLVQTF